MMHDDSPDIMVFLQIYIESEDEIFQEMHSVIDRLKCCLCKQYRPMIH